MHESDIQSDVSEAIMDREIESITLGVSDNERCVVVDIGDRDAYYTADEARHLADAIDQYSSREWDDQPEDIVEYIRDLATIVDAPGSEEASMVTEKWEDRDPDTSL